MDFGILFTSHSNIDVEPYPHRDVHARVTREICRADQLGFDYAWLAEHHFSDQYGIMPDVFVYAGYLAALTKHIKIGTAVVTLPLSSPVRVAENSAFLDVLSQGRFVLGLGSGDLIVNTSGAAVHHFDLPNVLFVGRKVQLIEDMLREKAVVRGR